MNSLRRPSPSQLTDIFKELAWSISGDREFWVEALARHEPLSTAQDEITKSIRTLETFDQELEYLAARDPFGEVYVSLPFNNPLYSTILYGLGPSLGGSPTTVRPSALTSSSVEELFQRYSNLLARCGVSLSVQTGPDFISEAITRPGVNSLIFTGSWPSIESIIPQYPNSKRLIYCGSGVNPFVVGSTTPQNLESAARILLDGRIYNSGQDCLCPERVYVHAEHSDRFLAELSSMAANVTLGDFGDNLAQVCPLQPPIATRALDIIAELDSSPAKLHYSSRITDNLIGPQIYELPRDHPLMRAEKFAPILTVSTFETEAELASIATSDHLFGATIIGDVPSESFTQYPHVTTDETLIQLEAQSLHLPFGGRARSGFSVGRGRNASGPILFSVETTESPHETNLGAFHTPA